MKKGKNVTLRTPGLWAWILGAACTVAFVGTVAASAVKSNDAPCAVMRLDAARGGTPKMPPVVFRHDGHVAAQAEVKEGCVSCHAELKDAKPGVPEGRPLRFVKSEADKDAWHAACLACHEKRSKGPRAAECHTCHDQKAARAASAQKVAFGRSLHAVHTGSEFIKPVQPEAGTAPAGKVENCGACHHTPDAKTGKLAYVPETEESCAACHKNVADGKVRSRKDASHALCVTCHVKTMEAAAKEKKDLKLPVNCVDCHTIAAQAKFPAPANPPRLMRGQPDRVQITPPADAKRSELKGQAESKGLAPVVFDHKRHEESQASCAVCHHKGITKDGCKACHTASGSADGKFVTWYEAMHAKDSDHSCTGCHNKRIASEKNCAACHADLKAGDTRSCTVCHSSAAAMAPQAPVTRTVTPLAPGDVPESVEIGALSKDYEPVKFPHRKIYEALRKGIENDALAAAFHTSPETACAACHHNIPASELKNPPKCASCHELQHDKMSGVKKVPSLKVAYHQQCMACHKRMDVKPVATDCTGCHAQKNGQNQGKGREVK